MNEFVARRLTQDYAISAESADGLVNGVRGGLGAAGRYWVMPVLDGLDELPTGGGRALSRLEEFAASDRPLVVTCRPREYQAAVDGVGVLSRAAVITLEPVSVDDAVGYLSYPQARRSWTTARSPSFTVTADRDGNRACVCTSLARQ